MKGKEIDRDPPHYELATQWWLKTHQNSGAMATLRRARSVLDIVQVPEALKLVSRLGSNFFDRSAILVGILSHVRHHEEERLLRKLGRKDLNDENAKLSVARFRRLLQCDGHELLDPMRRIVQLNENRANVHDLCQTILYWGAKRKQKLIFDYYAVTSADPNNRLTSL